MIRFKCSAEFKCSRVKCQSTFMDHLAPFGIMHDYTVKSFQPNLPSGWQVFYKANTHGKPGVFLFCPECIPEEWEGYTEGRPAPYDPEPVLDVPKVRGPGVYGRSPAMSTVVPQTPRGTFWVTYLANGDPHLYGPYTSFEEAVKNRIDIEALDGVTQAKVQMTGGERPKSW